jgi:hypothetical protein
MQFVTGLVSKAVPAHAFGVHVSKVFVFAVSAHTAFAHSVVEIATLVFKLIDSEALTNVSAMYDYPFSHAYLESSSLIIRTS